MRTILERSAPAPMTLEAFIAWADRQSGEVRYELVDGFPIALAQPTNAHNRLMMRLYDVIGPSVRAGRCDAYTSGSLVPTRRMIPVASLTCSLPATSAINATTMKR